MEEINYYPFLLTLRSGKLTAIIATGLAEAVVEDGHVILTGAAPLNDQTLPRYLQLDWSSAGSVAFPLALPAIAQLGAAWSDWQNPEAIPGFKMDGAVGAVPRGAAAPDRRATEP